MDKIYTWTKLAQVFTSRGNLAVVTDLKVFEQTVVDFEYWHKARVRALWDFLISGLFLMFVQTGSETSENGQNPGHRYRETKKTEAVENDMVMTEYRMPLWTDKQNATI